MKKSHERRFKMKTSKNRFDYFSESEMRLIIVNKFKGHFNELKAKNSQEMPALDLIDWRNL